MASDEDQPKKKSKLPLIIIIVLLLLILGGGGGAAYFFLFSGAKGDTAEDPAKQTVTQTVQTKGDAPSTGISATLPTLLVNLSDPLGKRFIKVSIELELSSPDVVQEITKNQARIQDSMILLLSSKTYSDLLPTEGKMMLKNEIITRMNQILNGPKVVRVFFTDMVIQ